jgi:hypothetical protein
LGKKATAALALDNFIIGKTKRSNCISTREKRGEEE